MPPCAQTECERLTGTIENKSTPTPSSASLIAQASPASPPPTTITRFLGEIAITAPEKSLCHYARNAGDYKAILSRGIWKWRGRPGGELLTTRARKSQWPNSPPNPFLIALSTEPTLLFFLFALLTVSVTGSGTGWVAGGWA